MKHLTVILLTLFVLQIYALPHPSLTRSGSKNEEPTSGNTSVESKGAISDSRSISTNTKVEQKSTNEIIEKELKSSTSITQGSISTNSKEEENKKPLTENVALESKKLISDTSSIPTKTDKDQKSISENTGVKSKSSINESNNIPMITKTDPKPSSRLQESPTSRSNKGNEESTGITSGSGSIPSYTKIEPMQRPPSYYYDMFNIPIAALQAVSNFLGGTPSNTNIRPPATSRPPVSKEYLRSPIEALSATPEAVSGSSDNANRPLNIPNIPGLNVINQISQIAQNKPGMLLRLPTIQDIINIPISTLNAVSHFLAENYATQPAPAISSPPVVAASNVVPSKVPIEGAAEPNKDRLKSGQILQTLENIPDHSTLIGVTEEVASTTNDQATSELHIKQILITNPNYYQDMINIPIATLKAVSNFLTTVYSDPSITALPSTAQGNKLTTDELSSASTKTSQTSAEVRPDTIFSAKISGSPQVTDKSSENSVLTGLVDSSRSNEDLMLVPEEELTKR